MATPQICTNCHTVGTGQRIIRGSFAIEILLWCFFGVGILYTLWRKSTVIIVCAACWHATLIPLTSPRGQALCTSLRAALVLCLALLSAAPFAQALQECTRPLLGDGPDLGPVVCTEVTSDRGTTLAVTEVPAIDQLALHQALNAPPLTPQEQASLRAAHAQNRLHAAADALRDEAARLRDQADAARQAQEAWRAQHGYIGQDGLWHPFTPRYGHRYDHNRRGTVVGPKRGGVFVKTKR